MDLLLIEEMKCLLLFLFRNSGSVDGVVDSAVNNCDMIIS